MALSFARDEFHWLLRHAENVPQKKSAATKAEDYVDRLSCTRCCLLACCCYLQPATVMHGTVLVFTTVVCLHCRQCPSDVK